MKESNPPRIVQHLRGVVMLEAFVIIGALGGLELVLWFFDHRQQKKQIELLDSIWAELAILNSSEEEQHISGRAARNPK